MGLSDGGLEKHTPRHSSSRQRGSSRARGEREESGRPGTLWHARERESRKTSLSLSRRIHQSLNTGEKCQTISPERAIL